MCGISALIGQGWQLSDLEAMVTSQHHRGPDAQGFYIDPTNVAGLGHNRLSIIDLSEAGRQPMSDPERRYWIIFNGEIYNYLELRRELQSSYPFRTRTDSEVLLAAYCKWGEGCLHRLIGMFAFAIWDERNKTLFAARDRFGVKPLYYGKRADGSLILASEIRTLCAGGLPPAQDPAVWATYLTYGIQDHSERTFWEGALALPAGCYLRWRNGDVLISRWYDLLEKVYERFDDRDSRYVEDEYLALLKESVQLRFRSDVPVGINLSGGLDSSTLLGLVHAVQGEESDVKAFTFCTGDPHYDELPWVRQMLERTRHELVICKLSAEDVPALCESVQSHQDEPFGGIPTLAYARLFEQARDRGVIVLLDGQGMDEQWAGYDYYRADQQSSSASVVQGTNSSPVRPDCLIPEFRALAAEFKSPNVFSDRLRNLQYRDSRYTKIPRALRFNDRVSMRSSTELREPFLDHRLFELALAQPSERKIANGTGKLLLRKITSRLLPAGVIEAPKRPLQTPQREWLRGPLRDWADGQIEKGLKQYGDSWFDRAGLRSEWRRYCEGSSDNSFYVWQWISAGLAAGSFSTSREPDARTRSRVTLLSSNTSSRSVETTISRSGSI